MYIFKPLNYSIRLFHQTMCAIVFYFGTNKNSKNCIWQHLSVNGINVYWIRLLFSHLNTITKVQQSNFSPNMQYILMIRQLRWFIIIAMWQWKYMQSWFLEFIWHHVGFNWAQ